MEQILYQGVLEEEVKTFENGVDTRLGSQGTKVSGGQRKRIALARMYAEDGKVQAKGKLAEVMEQSKDILKKELVCDTLIELHRALLF